MATNTATSPNRSVTRSMTFVARTVARPTPHRRWATRARPISPARMGSSVFPAAPTNDATKRSRTRALGAAGLRTTFQRQARSKNSRSSSNAAPPTATLPTDASGAPIWSHWMSRTNQIVMTELTAMPTRGQALRRGLSAFTC